MLHAFRWEKIMLIICIITSWFLCKRGLDFCFLNIWREKTKTENRREIKGKDSKYMVLLFKLTRTQRGDFQCQVWQQLQQPLFCFRFSVSSVLSDLYVETSSEGQLFWDQLLNTLGEGEPVTEQGQIKKGEMSEQREIWLTCENWENWEVEPKSLEWNEC